MNIKADSTIVASAGALARAKVPFSMRGMTAGLLQQRGELLDSISTNFEKSMQEIEGINAEAKEAMEKLDKNINDGTIDSSKERASMQDQLDLYREELKNIPLFGKENKRNRADLLYKVHKYTKDKQSQAKIGRDIVTSYNTDAYDIGLTKAPAIAFVKNFANYYNGDATDRSFKVEEVDGKNVYSFTYTNEDGKTTSFKKQSIEDISKILRKRDTGTITSANEVLNNWRETAKNNPKLEKQDVLQEIQNSLEELFKNKPDGFASVARTKMFGQSMSYYDALHNPGSEESKQILDVLFSMKPELDKNANTGSGDGEITADDFATEKNYEEFIKSLVDPNPQERTLAHSLAAKFYAEEEGGKAIDLGIKYRADEEESGGGRGTGGDGNSGVVDGVTFVSQYVGKKWVHWETLAERRQKVDLGETFTGSFGKYTLDADTGLYTITGTDDEISGSELSRYEVADREGVVGNSRSADFVWNPSAKQDVEVNIAHSEGKLDLSDLKGPNNEQSGVDAAKNINELYGLKGKASTFSFKVWGGVSGKNWIKLTSSDGKHLRWDSRGTVVKELGEDVAKQMDAMFEDSWSEYFKWGAPIGFDVTSKNAAKSLELINMMFEIGMFKEAKQAAIERYNAEKQDQQTIINSNTGQGDFD